MGRITCPVCGERDKDGIELYNPGLRRQNLEISPIYPTCKTCGSAVAIDARCQGGEIIVLNGTCGSGKSTVAEELVRRHGYYAIDGDCAMQAAKHRLGAAKVSIEQVRDEVARELDAISLFGDRMVLSHVIMPEEVEGYKRIFEERNLTYRFILLKPAYETAVARCQTRTCHNSVTPEYWIRYFYDLLVFDGGVEVIDNTELTLEQTVQRVLQLR